MPRPESMKIDPATRTFQAIRIYVNNEVCHAVTRQLMLATMIQLCADDCCSLKR